MHHEPTEQFIPTEQLIPAEYPVQHEPAKTRSRSSGLVAGIAIGAFIGAIGGGATGALIAANTTAPMSITSQSPTVISSSETTSGLVSAIAAAATPSVVTIEASTRDSFGTGSGVIYSSDGYIITNAHVVTTEGTSFANTNVRVFLSDGQILPAEIVGTAPYSDLAVIKVQKEGLQAITVADSNDIGVGDLTVAIGAPFNLSNTVTSGVVSTVNRGIAVGSPLIPRDDTLEDSETPWNFDFDIPGQRQQQQGGGQVTLPVIQTDADINPGNSGGALLNEAGQLIGINVAIASTGSEEERAGSVGLGFAIPSALAVRVADSIIAGEPVTHGLLGATVEDSRTAQNSTIRGGLIRDVTPGSAAAKAGLRSGDIIISVAGVATPDGTSVSAMVRFFESGSTVEIEVQRGDQITTHEVTLGSLI